MRESYIDEKTVSKYMDEYVDGDGWKPDAVDKAIVREAIKTLNKVTDSDIQVLSGLEWIRAFEQEGTVASKWLHSTPESNEYTPQLTEALKKLVGIWNQKLRGIKTYVFVNEIISYLIYTISQHQENPYGQTPIP
jgi:hypothetical protein